MEDKRNSSKDLMATGMARSQSWAVLQQSQRLGGGVRKPSDPFSDGAVHDGATSADSVPIQDAQSYRPTAAADRGGTATDLAGVCRLMATLAEPNNNPTTTVSRQSAASLKVHFRSIDDVSNKTDDSNGSCKEGVLDDGSFDSRRRSQSGEAPPVCSSLSLSSFDNNIDRKSGSIDL